MNLGQLKEKTLHLIREYSNQGSVIGLGENKDYMLSIPGAISDSQQEISLRSPVLKTLALSDPSSVSVKFNRFNKPERFKEIMKISFNDEFFSDYIEEVNEICIPKSYNGEFILTYSVVPMEFNSKTDDNTELEIDKEYQYITCYKAAADIYLDDNSDFSLLFNAEYKRLLNNIKPKRFKNIFTKIENIY